MDKEVNKSIEENCVMRIRLPYTNVYVGNVVLGVVRKTYLENE